MTIALFLPVLQAALTTAPVILLLAALSAPLGNLCQAHVKKLLWLAVAVRMLLPFQVTVGRPVIALPMPEPSASVQAMATISVTGPEQGSAVIALPAGARETGRDGADGFTALAAVWMCGALCTGLWQLLRCAADRRVLRRWSIPVESESVREQFTALCEELEIRAPVALLRCGCITSPMLTGLLRPVLLLPLQDFSALRTRLILLHELEHLRRRDLWYRLVLLCACCVQWFNPLCWWMARRAALDIEIACDEAVLSREGAARREYGEAMLEVVRAASRLPALSTAFHSGAKGLKARFAAILDESPKSRGIAVAALLLLLVILSGTALAWTRESARTTNRAAVDATNANRLQLVQVLREKLESDEEAYILLHATLEDLKDYGITWDSETTSEFALGQSVRLGGAPVYGLFLRGDTRERSYTFTPDNGPQMSGLLVTVWFGEDREPQRLVAASASRYEAYGSGGAADMNELCAAYEALGVSPDPITGNWMYQGALVKTLSAPDVAYQCFDPHAQSGGTALFVRSTLFGEPTITTVPPGPVKVVKK